MSVQITIDQRQLTVEKGITILQAARLNGIYIPTLCDYPRLPSRGSCRMCIVEVQGRPNTPTACTTPVEDGMVIQTASPKVQELRSELLRMLLAEHPSGCLFCPEKEHCEECMVTLRKAGVTTGCRSCAMNEQCELQEMVEKSGLSGVNFPVRYRMLPVEKNDPFFDRDYNLCILCGRCIRICEELHFSNTLAYTQRGAETLVSTAFGRTHLEAGCSFCGSCVEACPTGALSEKTRKWDGKPEAETQSTCPFCSIGCQISLLSKDHLMIGSLPNHPSGTDLLCVKGRFGITELVNHPTRLKHPQKQVDQERVRVTWEESIQLAAQKLAGCPSDAFEMVISDSCSTEDLYIARKFTQQVMKSSHIQTSAQARYGDGLPAVVEFVKQSAPLSAILDADAVLVLGVDGKYAQSVVEVRLHEAQKQGARLMTFLPEDHFLQDFADVALKAAPGKEVEGIQQFTLPLQQARNPVVVIGPGLLAHSQNLVLLKAVDLLIKQTKAKVVTLPEQGNLSGSILMGLSQQQPGTRALQPEVLYLIGGDIPLNVESQTYIIYQNIVPPSEDHEANLIFPICAFTEENATLIDHAGHIHETHAAVPAPGEALSSWEIMCQIAQAMGAEGFKYTSVEDVRAEIGRQVHGYRPSGQVDRTALPGAPYAIEPMIPAEPSLRQIGQVGEHGYMGFPLTDWVEGLRMLYPDEPTRKGESHV